MKCPKCGYLGFESGDRCRNCGYDFSLAAAEPVGADLPIQTGEEPHGPLADFSLAEDRSSEPGNGGSPRGRGVDLGRVVGKPAADADLPLFLVEEPDEPPIVQRGTLRPPLAVRRATPEAPRLRSRAVRPQPVELAFETEPATPEPPGRVTRAFMRALDATPAAGVGRRAAAAAIDAAILLAIDAAVLYFTLRLCGLRVVEIGILPVAPFAAFLLLLKAGYLTVFTAAGGQTIGKMAAGIRVVSSDARPVDFGRATCRTAAWFLAVLPLGLGFAPLLLGGGRRALPDRLASTRVVRETS